MYTNSCCATLIASHIISVNVVMGISIGGPFTMLISRPRWFAKMARATRRYVLYLSYPIAAIAVA